MEDLKNKLTRYRNRIKAISCKKKGRRVHFLVPNRNVGSSITRGYQISSELNRQGVYSCVFEWDYRPQRVREIKNSVFVVLKTLFKGNYELLAAMKKNGNILVWDPLDSFMDIRNAPEAELLDGVILMNRKCAQDIASSLRKDCAYGTIPHHWDRRCRPNRAEGYRLLYLGDTTPENILKEHIEGIEELHVIKCNSEKLFVDSLDEVAKYNCHFSVRSEGLDSFRFKPAVKLSLASATDSNIVISRDFANLELLDASYPYYTDSDLASVKQAVRYSKETFGTKVWHDALKMIEDVKERTSLENIARDYIEFVSRF